MKLTETIKLPIWRKINKFSLCIENNMYINKVTSWKNLYSTSKKCWLPWETYMLDFLFTPWEPTNACQHPEQSWPWGAFQSCLSTHVFLHNQVSTPQQVWTATVPFSILPLILFLQETSNNNKHTTVPHVPSWNPPSPSWQGETLSHKPSANICLWARDLTEVTRQKCMALHPPH